MTTSNPIPPPEPNVTSEFTVSFHATLDEMRRLLPSDLLAVNLDMRAAVATILGALPEIVALRDRIERLPELDQSAVASLARYAQAAWHANSLAAGANAPIADIGAVNERATVMRDTFLSDARALVHRGLIPAQRIEPFKGLFGYKLVAYELSGLADVIIDSWKAVDGKTAITLAELNGAKELAEQLVTLAGKREQGPPVTAEVALDRQRAYTLCVRAYDETRRAVSYLRWREGDADTITPSLWAGRGGRGKPEKATGGDAQSDDNGQSTPATPAPQPAAKVPPGMPGGSPFVD